MGDIGVKSNIKIKLSSIAVAISTLLIGLISPAISYAATANMYLTASSNSVAKNSNLDIGVRINSGDTSINAVQANLNYSSDKFDFVSITPASTFPIESENSGGNGSIHMGRGIIGSVKGDQLIATVTLKAKNTGTGDVKFAAGSSATESGSNKMVQVSTGDATYTIGEEQGSSSAGSANDKIAPKISNVKVSEVGYSTAKITWKTSEPARTEINYGTNKSYGITATDNNYVTDHSMTLASEALTAGTTYHFRITNRDTAGNASSTADSTFTTRGSSIIVTVVGKSDRPVKGALVTVDNSTSQKTDEDGKVIFSNLGGGKHTVVAQAHDKSAKVTATTSIPQFSPTNVKVKLDVNQISTFMALLIVIALAIIAVLLARQLKKSNNKKGGGEGKDTAPSEIPVVRSETKAKPHPKKSTKAKK
jgi:hypothetical protein